MNRVYPFLRIRGISPLYFPAPPSNSIPLYVSSLSLSPPLANSRAVSPVPFVSRAEDKTNTENEEERATRTASGITRLYRGTCDQEPCHPEIDTYRRQKGV